jgi:putative FmdB family regulatory protein
MPTYEYSCTECGHTFEIVQSFSDDALTECRECRGALRKVFGSVGIVFKGSGFYKTDTRGTSSATSTAAPSEPSATASESATPSAPATPSTSVSTSGSDSSSTAD